MMVVIMKIIRMRVMRQEHKRGIIRQELSVGRQRGKEEEVYATMEISQHNPFV
jgi:hypothetical protein